MVRRLIEQQQVGRECKRQRERRALAFSAGKPRRIESFVQAEAMQELDQPRFDTPAFAVVRLRLECPSLREAGAQRRRRNELGLLFHPGDFQSVAAPDFAGVEIELVGDDSQQRTLAGPVASDQADAICRPAR